MEQSANSSLMGALKDLFESLYVWFFSTALPHMQHFFLEERTEALTMVVLALVILLFGMRTRLYKHKLRDYRADQKRFVENAQALEQAQRDLKSITEESQQNLKVVTEERDGLHKMLDDQIAQIVTAVQQVFDSRMQLPTPVPTVAVTKEKQPSDVPALSATDAREQFLAAMRSVVAEALSQYPRNVIDIGALRKEILDGLSVPNLIAAINGKAKEFHQKCVLLPLDAPEDKIIILTRVTAQELIEYADDELRHNNEKCIIVPQNFDSANAKPLSAYPADQLVEALNLQSKHAGKKVLVVDVHFDEKDLRKLEEYPVDALIAFAKKSDLATLLLDKVDRRELWIRLTSRLTEQGKYCVIVPNSINFEALYRTISEEFGGQQTQCLERVM